MKSPLLYFGIALVLVLSTALIAPMVIDWSNYRVELERYGSRIAGREVRIDGPVRIRLLPTPVISLSDVRMANVKGATADSFITAKQFNMRLALSPLLKGRVEVESLTFDGATFEFERMADSGGNWHLQPQQSWAQVFSPDAIGVASASITDSVIVLRDRNRRGVAFLDDVNLEVSAVSLAGPYRVKGALAHEGQLLYVSAQTGRRAANGEMRLAVTLEPDGDYVPSYVFDGKFSGTGSDVELVGKLRISRNLPILAEDAEPLETADVGLPFSFKSSVRAGFREIALENIELLLDQAQPGSVVEGAIGITLGEEIGLDVDLETRHFNLDRVAKRAGLSAHDLAPGLELVDSVSHLMAAAPDDLKGRFRLAARALTMGGETVEAAEVTARVEGSHLTISQVRGVLPGRSELKLSDLELAIRAGVPGFEGDMAFSSRDTRGFLVWALPRLKARLEAAPRAFKGTSRFTGRIALDGKSLGVRRGRLEFDGSNAQGALLVVPAARPQVFGNLVLAGLDLDRYFPPSSGPAAGYSIGKDPFETIFAGVDPAFLTAFDGRFMLVLDRVRRWGLLGERITASVEVRDGGLVLQDAKIRDFNGTDLDVSGEVAWRKGVPYGKLSARLEAEQLRRALSIPLVRRLAPVDPDAHREVLGELSPANMTIELVSAELDNLRGSAATINGDLGGTAVELDASYRGEWGRMRDGKVELTGSVQAVRNDTVMRLLGLELPAGAGDAGGGGRVAVALSGTLSKGLDATLTVQLLDTRVDVKGQITSGADRLAVDSEVVAKSDDATELLRALHLLPADESPNPVAVDLKGLLSGNRDEIVISSLGGRLAGVPVGVDGTADMTGDRPRLYANLTVAQVDLPWVMSRVFSLPERLHQEPAGENAAATSPWSATPFDFTMLRAVDLSVALRAGDLILMGGRSASEMQAEITVSDGTVKVDGFRTRFAGGELSAAATLRPERGRLSAEADFELTNAELSATLTSGVGTGPLRGRYSLSGKLRGTGRSPIGFVSSLAGDGLISIDSAVLLGINPGSFSQALQKVSTASELDHVIAGILVDGEMSFSGLTASYEMRNGVARFAETEIDGTDATGSVRGTVDLPAWRLDSKWNIGLKTHPEAPALTVRLGGALAEPERSYDTAALRSFFVVKGLTEGVTRLERLQREEEERLQRLEEMEREARRREALRKAEERRKAEEQRKAEERRKELEQRNAEEQRRKVEKLKRLREEALKRAREEEEKANEVVPEPPSSDEEAAVTEEGAVLRERTTSDADAAPEPVAAPPATHSITPDTDTEPSRETGPRLVVPRPKSDRNGAVFQALPDPDAVNSLPLTDPALAPGGDVDTQTTGQTPLELPDADAAVDPVEVTPKPRSRRVQENLFSDDPADWRK